MTGPGRHCNNVYKVGRVCYKQPEVLRASGWCEPVRICKVRDCR